MIVSDCEECVFFSLLLQVALGTVTNVEEAVKWLSYTYLYVRMRANPLAYGINHKAYQVGQQKDLFFLWSLVQQNSLHVVFSTSYYLFNLILASKYTQHLEKCRIL